MDARSVLSHLRQGVPLRDDELHWFARGLASGVVSDAQAAAFAILIAATVALSASHGSARSVRMELRVYKPAVIPGTLSACL